MADIDLKTETPDATLPSTGFLFGADSQAAASPSVYSTQAVATALLGSTSLTGATITADAPVLNLAQTWNNAAVTFTGMRFNVPTDTSNASSLLMDLQVGGVSVAHFRKDGTLRTPAIHGFSSVSLRAGTGGDGYGSAIVTANSSNQLLVPFGYLSLNDVLLTRRGAANLRLGAADTTGTTAPTAQTLSVQSWASSTNNNQPGANFTIDGSQGTGTGAGGSIIFRVAPAGGVANGVQNALATALTINNDRSVSIVGREDYGTDLKIGPTGNVGIGQYVSNMFYISIGTEKPLNVYSSGSDKRFSVNNDYWIGWGVNTADGTLKLFRDAADTLALRRGTNRQVSRIYSTYTDASNGSWVEISTNLYGADQAGVMRKANGSGTSVTPDLYLGSDISNGGIFFRTSNTTRWQFNSAGHFLAQTDNSVDIGASGATRPRDVYVANRIYTPSVQAGGGAGTGIVFRSTGGSGISQIDGNGSFYVAYATALPAGGTTGRGLHFSSNTTNFGVFFGSGAPTLSAAKGSLYLRSDGTTTNDRMYVNTDGATTWTAVTTVA